MKLAYISKRLFNYLKNRTFILFLLLIVSLLGAHLAVYFFDVRKTSRSEVAGATIFNTSNLAFFVASVLAITVIFLVIQLAVNGLKTKKIINFERFKAQNSKDELLSLASHQLRTPATAVKQYLGMILQGYAGDMTLEQHQLVHKAYRSNERQLVTINQMLYVARADAGRLDLQLSKFDIKTLIEDIINELQSVVLEKQQKLKFKTSYKSFMVCADKHIMRMVIENLITNAIKYTHQGGKINILLDKQPKIAIIAVQDNGVGINFEDRVKLFKKFSRIDNELSVQAGGSGIGLYLDKILVELHGGHIRVFSLPNKGTTFSIHLPIKAMSENSRSRYDK